MARPANDITPDPVAAARVVQASREAAERARRTWTGPRWERERDVATVAKLLRGDMKAAYVEGKVTIQRYSGGQRLRIVVTPPPAMLLANPARMRQDLDPAHEGPLANRLTPEAAALLASVEAMANAYNRGWENGGHDFHVDADFAEGLRETQVEAIRVSLLPR